MRRYGTRIEDGRIYLEDDDGWFAVGTTEDVVALAGETYVVEYDRRAAAMDWLDTDDEGRMEFDVLETIESTTHPEEFVALVRDAPPGEKGDEGDDGNDEDEEGTSGNGDVPARTELFVDLLTTIWDGKGRPMRE